MKDKLSPFNWKAQASKLAKHFAPRNIPGADGKPVKNPTPLPTTDPKRFHMYSKAVPK